MMQLGDLLLYQGGVMCNCVIANLVVSRFPKDRDIGKQWVFVVHEASNNGKQSMDPRC